MTGELLPVVPAPDWEIALAVAVAELPLPTDDADRRWNMRSATHGWLRSRKSVHTRRAYLRDLKDYLDWCDRSGLDPRVAMRGDIDAYAADRCAALSATSAARRLSTLSSWYKYLVSNGVTVVNPVDAVDRPTVDHDYSSTVGLTGTEVTAFMRTARAQTGRTAHRDAALLGLLAELALRVGEVLALDLASLRHNKGHRTVKVEGKGKKPRELPIPAPMGRNLDEYLANRGDAPGALFVTSTGTRVDQPAVFRIVRRVAKSAGLPAAAQLSPHSLRHSALTAMLDAGAPLRDVQDVAGHADPRTTRRYDRGRGSLDRSPVYLIAPLFADDDETTG